MSKMQITVRLDNDVIDEMERRAKVARLRRSAWLNAYLAAHLLAVPEEPAPEKPGKGRKR